MNVCFRAPILGLSPTGCGRLEPVASPSRRMSPHDPEPPAVNDSFLVTQWIGLVAEHPKPIAIDKRTGASKLTAIMDVDP